MTYCKKVSVLKQFSEDFSGENKKISGIIRVETESEIGTVFISIINLSVAERGEYFCYVLDSGNILHKFNLGKRPASFTKNFPTCPAVERGFSAGIFYLEDNLPVLVAYSKSEDYFGSLQDLKRAVSENCLSDYKNSTAKNRAEEIYNDEAVATENYFDLEEQISQKINLLEGWQNESLSNENGQTVCGSQEKENKEQERTDSLQDEADFGACKEYSEYSPYYDKVNGELTALFEKFPEERALLSLFPTSKWVKVYYSEGKYYTVGVINDLGKPKYICYGIPHEYSENPPQELSGISTFIPLSIFNLRGAGYWMMFQDAITGECVKMG